MSDDRRDDMVRLADILAALHRVVLYTKEGQEAFLRSSQIQDAVVRNLEIAGEAAGKLSEGLRREHSEVEWPKLRGFASFAKHEYWKIEAHRLWAAVEETPLLERAISRIRADRVHGQ
jgi:uncharacterized protein with HEPN domain